MCTRVERPKAAKTQQRIENQGIPQKKTGEKRAGGPFFLGGGVKGHLELFEKTSVLVGSSVPKPRMEVLLQVCRKKFF